MATKKVQETHKITFHGPTGKTVEKLIVATRVRVLDGVENSLICFEDGAALAFSVPLSTFITSEIVRQSPPVTKPALRTITPTKS